MMKKELCQGPNKMPTLVVDVVAKWGGQLLPRKLRKFLKRFFLNLLLR